MKIVNSIVKNIKYFFSLKPKEIFTKTISFTTAMAMFSSSAFAYGGLPENGQVVQGDAAISVQDTNMTINQNTHQVIINWDSFSIGVDNSVEFVQPSSSSIALNRVVGQDPSDIMGNLTANGRVILINPNGVFFGQNSVMDISGLIATTADMDNSDFMNGNLNFNSTAPDGSVVENQGLISVKDGGFVALVAPEVRNSGTIIGKLSKIELAGTSKFAIDLHGDGLIQYDVSDTSPALVKHSGTIIANGGLVRISANDAESLLGGVVKIDGDLIANKVTQENGEIILGRVEVDAGDYGQVSTTGKIEAKGGSVDVKSNYASIGGDIDVSDDNGGNVNIDVKGTLSLAENIDASGVNGAGGNIDINANTIMASSTASVDSKGTSGDGGNVSITADNKIIFSGSVDVSSTNANGGRVDISAKESTLLISANINASGQDGGLVRVGGEFQGGKDLDPTKDYNEHFVNKWGDTPDLQSTNNLFINDSSVIDISGQNNDGTAIMWSDEITTMTGSIKNNNKNAFIEVSSTDTLRYIDLVKIDQGENVTLLLDPKNITIADSAGGSSIILAALLNDQNVGALDETDSFGESVSLNSAGDRLAVGSIGDSGPINADGAFAGAVYLFSFTDTSFGGAALEATIGDGYTGGKNIDNGLINNPEFGSGVSLNAAGDRLAIGAKNGGAATGVVQLYSFTDTSFTGGNLEATIGDGFSGGKNIDVALDAGDRFGRSVSLNSAGDLLAVGASGDSDNSNLTSSAGAVYLFSFTDTSFTGGNLEAKIGEGYTGGKNINIDLDNNDNLGHTLSLNGAGDLLAVGAYGDAGNTNSNGFTGAVYLYSFTDTSFSGGALEATIGLGYTGGKNIDVANLEGGDNFAKGVSLNDAGDILAVGSSADSGNGNSVSRSGAVYLLSFTDTSFTGGSVDSIIGKGYSDYDVSALEANDGFGTSVALNGAGDLLAVGVNGDDGNGNSASGIGAVSLFTISSGGGASVSSVNFATDPTDTSSIDTAGLETTLGAGTNVILQASNDITVEDDITVNNAGGDGGNLTLQAGRSILIQDNITTDNGDLTLIANDTVENGVVDGNRDAGNAVITMDSGTTITAGTGDVSIILRAGLDKINSANGDISLRTITAASVNVAQSGASANTSIIFNNGITTTGNQTYTGDLEFASSALLQIGNGQSFKWTDSTTKTIKGSSGGETLTVSQTDGTKLFVGRFDTNDAARLGLGSSTTSFTRQIGEANPTFDSAHLQQGTLRGGDDLSTLVTGQDEVWLNNAGVEPDTETGSGTYNLSWSDTSKATAINSNGYLLDLSTNTISLTIASESTTNSNVVDAKVIGIITKNKINDGGDSNSLDSKFDNNLNTLEVNLNDLAKDYDSLITQGDGLFKTVLITEDEIL